MAKIKKFTRAWYEKRGEVEAYDNFSAWLKEQLLIEVAYRDHFAKWGVHCGPTLEMVMR